MATFAYLRISTDEQNIQSQKYGVLDYANKNNLGTIQIIEDTESSRIDWKNRASGKLIKQQAQSQDTILFPEVTRAARNPLELLDMMKVAGERELKLIFIKENLTFNAAGQSEIEKLQTKHFITMLGMAGEISREFTRQRTIEGIQRAKAEGKPVGRQKGQDIIWKLDHYYDLILKQLKRGQTQISIVRMLNSEDYEVNVHRNSFNKWMKRWKLTTLRSLATPNERTAYIEKVDQTREKIKAYLAEHKGT